MNYKEIIENKNYGKLISYMIDEVLKELFWKSIDGIFNQLKKEYKINLEDIKTHQFRSDTVNQIINSNSGILDKGNFKNLREIYYRRNTLVHNQGKADDSYISRVNKILKIGEHLLNDRQYVDDSLNILIFYGAFIADKVISKIPSPK